MGLLFAERSISSTLIAFLFLVSSLPARSSADKPTAYDVLLGYNFPVGILPKGVAGYELDESTGKFSAFLNGSCGFSIENSYKLDYKSTIKGYISDGKLARLEGVKVKLLFMWVDIVEVNRSGDSLLFSVGIASAGFTIDNFEESPQCGCGFDCVSGHKTNLRTNPIGLSSS